MADVQLRAVTAADWPEIARVANEALPQAPDGNAAWFAARMQLPDGSERRHYVAITPDETILAYGAIERDSDDAHSWRLFIVAGTAHLEGAGEALYTQLLADLGEVGARRVWMREQADDADILAFAQARGFAESARYRAGELDVVVVERRLV